MSGIFCLRRHTIACHPDHTAGAPAQKWCAHLAGGVSESWRHSTPTGRAEAHQQQLPAAGGSGCGISRQGLSFCSGAAHSPILPVFCGCMMVRCLGFATPLTWICFDRGQDSIGSARMIVPVLVYSASFQKGGRYRLWVKPSWLQPLLVVLLHNHSRKQPPACVQWL